MLHKSETITVDFSQHWMINKPSVAKTFADIELATKQLPQIFAQNPDMRVYDKENYWPPAGTFMSELRPYDVNSDGILIIPVQGSLIYDVDITFGKWITGYDYIMMAIIRGLADNAVKGIVLNVDSHGGTVSGVFELSKFISAASKIKPIISLVEANCMSAAYAIASSANMLYMSVGALCGSIGVVIRHTDISKLLDEEGIKVSFIHAGARKIDGAMEKPLGKDEESAIKAIVDDFYELFCLQVAESRGISKESVIKTEAGVFGAKKSVEMGLADIGHDLDIIMNNFVEACSPKKE